MAKKNHSGVPSQTHAPCDYKRSIPGQEYGGNSRPIQSRMGGNNSTVEKMQHPIMKALEFDEQTPQLCHNSSTNGKRQ